MKRLLSGVFGFLLVVGITPAAAFAADVQYANSVSDANKSKVILVEDKEISSPELYGSRNAASEVLSERYEVSKDGFTREPVTPSDPTNQVGLGVGDFTDGGLSESGNIAMTFATGLFVLVMYAAIIASIAIVLTKQWDADRR